MSDGFGDMIHRAIGFFRELEANNTREFFETRKDFYTSEIKKPAELMADLLAEDLARLTGKPHGPKLFRIHRDVRFSKDKTPYNTHLHMVWRRPGDAVSPVWFFGAAPSYLTLGMGVMGLEKGSLARYRRLVDEQGDDLTDEMALAEKEARVTMSDWGPAPLKRVPKPYDAEHPHAELLKRKTFTIHAPLPEDWDKKGVLRTLNELCGVMSPIWRRLDAAFPG